MNPGFWKVPLKCARSLVAEEWANMPFFFSLSGFLCVPYFNRPSIYYHEASIMNYRVLRKIQRSKWQAPSPQRIPSIWGVLVAVVDMSALHSKENGGRVRMVTAGVALKKWKINNNQTKPNKQKATLST